jgi:hypothetical protein
MKRDFGYYWIRLEHADWQPAEFTQRRIPGRDGGLEADWEPVWFTCGEGGGLIWEKEILAIGPRIEIPVELK